METLVLFAALVWLLVETLQRRAREARLAAELEALRKEVRALAAPAGTEPAPAPAPEPMADTAPVQVPQWIRDLPAPPARIPAPRRSFDWEALVGVRLFSYVAGIALLVAAVAFLKFGAEHGWLGPPVRMGIGAMAGLGLVAGGESRRARAYPVTAQALAAAGIATLFSTCHAASALWGLLPPVAAFLLMALVTAAAVVLALRRDAVVIALLGLLGGFSTPLVMASGRDLPFGLFGYLGLLNLGLGWLAYRKRWPLLTALALVFTALYQARWAMRFLAESNLGIGAGVFLLFPVLAFGGLFLAGPGPDGAGPAFRRTAGFSALPPLLFALRMALDPVYGAHWGLMFGFLFLVAAGLAAVALLGGPEWPHALGGAGVLAVTAAWLACSYAPAAWPTLIGLFALFAALYIWLPGLRALLGRAPFRGPALAAALVAPLLMFALPGVIVQDPAAEPRLLFAGALAILAMAAAFAARWGRGAVYVLAALAVLGAELAWTVQVLDAGHLRAGLEVYAGCGLAFLAAPVLARDLPWKGPAALLGLTSVMFLGALAGDPRLAAPPGPFLAALGLLTLAMGAVALRLGRGGVLAGHAVLGQAVLMAWLLGMSRFGPGVVLVPWVSLVLAGLGWLWFALGAARGDGWFPRSAGVGLLAAQAVLVLHRGHAYNPEFTPHLLGHALLAAGLLFLARRTGRQGWALALAVATAPVLAVWAGPMHHPAQAVEVLQLALPIYLLQLAHPLLLGAEARKGRLPWAAAVLASAVVFFAARAALVQLGGAGWIGALPLVQALLLAPHLGRARRDGGPANLALVAGAVLAFVTVAVPLQLDQEWITLGWALLGAALAWLFTRVPHRGLLIWCAGLFAAVFVRLAFNPAVLAYHARSEAVLVNWYLYTYLVPAGCCFLAARLLRGQGLLARLLPAAGAALLFLLLNIEIANAFSTGRVLTFNFAGGSLPQDLAYTIGWAVYAILLLAAGVAARARPARVAAILLLTATILKAFLHDLSRLTGLYRVASFVGLAIGLALVAVILQKYVRRLDEDPQDPVAH